MDKEESVNTTTPRLEEESKGKEKPVRKHVKIWMTLLVKILSADVTYSLQLFFPKEAGCNQSVWYISSLIPDLIHTHINWCLIAMQSRPWYACWYGIFLPLITSLQYLHCKLGLITFVQPLSNCDMFLLKQIVNCDLTPNCYNVVTEKRIKPNRN